MTHGRTLESLSNLWLAWNVGNNKQPLTNARYLCLRVTGDDTPSENCLSIPAEAHRRVPIKGRGGARDRVSLRLGGRARSFTKLKSASAGHKSCPMVIRKVRLRSFPPSGELAARVFLPVQAHGDSTREVNDHTHPVQEVEMHRPSSPRARMALIRD